MLPFNFIHIYTVKPTATLFVIFPNYKTFRDHVANIKYHFSTFVEQIERIMKNTDSTKLDTTIEANIIKPGSWCQITIVSVIYGFSQRLMDGKWVNTTAEPQRHETVILTIGKFFEDSIEAEKFMGTKFFKSLLNTVKKTWI